MDHIAAQFVNLLVGKKLRHFCCEAEMFDFDFAPLVLHAMGCSRVIKNNEFNSEIIDGIVISVKVSPWHDLRIELDNGVVIECLIANAYPHYVEEQEQWVLFEHTRDHSGTFLTVYNRSIDFGLQSRNGDI